MNRYNCLPDWTVCGLDLKAHLLQGYFDKQNARLGCTNGTALMRLK